MILFIKLLNKLEFDKRVYSMNNQLKGIALIIFAVLIVVIGIAMTPDFSATFANIMAIIGGFVGFFGVALAFIGDSEEK